MLSASRRRPAAKAPERVGTKTVARAMFRARGRFNIVSLFESIPARRTASWFNASGVGRPG